MYPDGQSARDRFVVSHRPGRAAHDPWKPHGISVEDEATTRGTPARVATVFLTGRECPWRCAMCDLWKYTIPADTPPGAIASQVAAAVSELNTAHPDVVAIKLYNAGSFFDPRAVPESDYDEIASATARFDSVIVECHPSLVGSRTARFLTALLRRRGATPADGPTLEVALGLETAHPAALDRLNKHMSVADFGSAASRLAAMGATLRVFLLVSPPFVPESEQDEWLLKSVDTALIAGATAISLIPTRRGNGTIEALEADGQFRAPHLVDVERSLSLALDRMAGRARVFADLWDLDQFATCAICLAARRERLRSMNLEQRILPPVPCPTCGGSSNR